MSHRNSQELEFRDANDPDQVVYRHSVAPQTPGLMYTDEALTTLLYIDTSMNPNQVCWLDCRTLPPKSAKGRTAVPIP